MDTLSAHSFTWSGNTGSCDASDLPVSLPETFAVAGRTRTVEFRFLSDVLDAEGDLAYAVYRSPDNNFAIHVYND